MKYLNELKNSRNEFNIGALFNNVVDQFRNFEDKNGKFHLIRELTRYKSNKINHLVDSIYKS